MKTQGMESQSDKKRATSVKTYVKPTVARHEAATMLVGSNGACECGYYVSVVGSACDARARPETTGYCYYN